MIRGKTLIGSSVSVNESNAIVEEDGTFVSAVYLKQGPNTITISAKSAAGEEIKKEITVYGEFE